MFVHTKRNSLQRMLQVCKITDFETPCILDANYLSDWQARQFGAPYRLQNSISEYICLFYYQFPTFLTYIYFSLHPFSWQQQTQMWQRQTRRVNSKTYYDAIINTHTKCLVIQKIIEGDSEWWKKNRKRWPFLFQSFVF